MLLQYQQMARWNGIGLSVCISRNYSKGGEHAKTIVNEVNTACQKFEVDSLSKK